MSHEIVEGTRKLLLLIVKQEMSDQNDRICLSDVNQYMYLPDSKILLCSKQTMRTEEQEQEFPKNRNKELGGWFWPEEQF